MAWTEEEIESMHKLWDDEGLSASQIARYVQTTFRKVCTRNAVVGLAHRRGWRSRAQGCTPGAKRECSTTFNSYHRKTVKPPKTEPWQQDVTRADIHNLVPYGPDNDIPAAGLCRYIRDEPGSGHWACCGYPTGDRDTPGTQEGDSAKPYCNAHNSIMRVAGTAHDPNYKRRGPKAHSIKLSDEREDKAAAFA